MMDREHPLPRVTAGDTWSYTLDTGPAHTGAQGEVFFGTRSDGTDVAVKVGGVGPASQGLLHEIGSLRALATAGIQGVVPVLDVVDVDGLPGMVMPRYRHTLLEWVQHVIDEPGTDTLDDVLKMSATIARILAGVHQTQWGGDTLLHRDVKPENLFLDGEQRVVLGDFGGAMGISGLQAVEIALFGSPMYAPLDQILPGRAIPDTTWDTYALCVILYMALTGARPAYQSDPRSLLTARGQELWGLAQDAIHAEGGQAQRLRLRFAQARVGTTAADLIDPTGKSALNTHDRELLVQRVEQLAELAGTPEGNRRRLQKGVWQILTRGLSPVSHPSPPNRFRDAEDLAEQLEDLRDLVHDHTPAPRPTPPPQAPESPLHDPPVQRRGGGTLWLVAMMLVASVLLLALAAAAVVLRYPPSTWFADRQTADIPAGLTALSFERAPADPVQLDGAIALIRLDRLEDPSAAQRIGIGVESPVRGATLLAVDAAQAPLARVDLGPRPVGEHLQRWQPPPLPVTLVAQVDPPDTIAHTLVEGVLAFKDGGITLGGTPVQPESILAWTGEVEIEAFRMDRTEVSEGRWQACVDAGACPAIEGAGPDHPVVGVTFEEARGFCRFAGGDLPSEGQWRRAHGSQRYPWGNDRPTCRLAHGAGCADAAQPVGGLPAGASAEGVMDLAGNAWEWVRGGTGAGAPLLVGGSIETRGATLGAAARQRARGRSALAGLRCAYPASDP